MKNLLSFMGVCCVLLSTPSKADGQDRIRARLGLSTVSGLVALEYQKNNFALNLGFLPAVDTGPFHDDKLRIAIGTRYFMAPEVNANGLLGGLSFMTNSEAVWESDGMIHHYNALFLTAGYRLSFGDRFDLTLGGGYGANLGLSDDAKTVVNPGIPSFDITLGFAIK